MARDYGLQNPPSKGAKGKKRWAMVIDVRRCIGCQACTVACKAQSDVPLGVWRTWVKTIEKGKYPHVKRIFIPRLCNHCDYPVCVRTCPVQATYKHPDGFVLQRYNRCIGCKNCMIACPYNSRHLLPQVRTYDNEPHGVADKCDFCVARVTRGLVPACVNTCVGGARIFGDLNDPESEVNQLLEKNGFRVLKEEAGTRPQVYYIGLDSDIDNTESYLHRSEQMKGEFNAFKENHEGFGGDILDGKGFGKSFVMNVKMQLKGFVLNVKNIFPKTGGF
jgi:Fe-S-cluster-containing dehydrogenase component